MPRRLTHWLKPRTRLGLEALEAREVPDAAAPGGTTTAVADLDGDGYGDLIAAGGPGLGAIVSAYSGRTGQQLATRFNPFPGEDFTTVGLFVAAGDIDGDGRAELAVGPDQGGGARVQVFSLNGGSFGRRANFFAIDDQQFRGGARIAMGDVNGDGRADLMAGAGFSGGPRVAVYDGRWLATGGGAPKLFNDFFAFESTLRDGVYTAIGDLTGDGRADLVFGGGPGGGPRVLAVDAARMLAGDAAGAFANPIANYFAFDPGLRNGVGVSAANLDADAPAEVVAAEGPGGGSAFSVFGTGIAPFQFGSSFPVGNGLRVSAGDLTGDGVPEYLASPASGAGRAVELIDSLGNTLFTLADPFDPSATIPAGAATAPVLGLALDRAEVSEAAGAQAARLTVTRGGGGVDRNLLVVNLAASDPAGVTVPSAVFFPAGVTQVVVDVGVANNAVRDGTRPVTLTASAAGAAPVAVILAVTDDEPAPPTDRATALLAWNATLLDAVRADASTPPAATRAMAMVNLALYDVEAGVGGRNGYVVTQPPPAGADAAAAVAEAGRRVLAYLYPAQQATFAARQAQLLSAVPAGPARDAGVAYGAAVAEAVIAARRDDGATGFADYTPGPAVGDWEPTPPMYMEEQTPEWATVQPFALSRPSEFRAAAPPAAGSPEWLVAFEEVRELGDATRVRTADEAQLPRLWADGAGTITPPGHWLQIALNAAASSGLDGPTTARLFATLGVALADAAIAAWDSKYTYGTWRPITAVREADRLDNPDVVPDPGWTPLLVTPNHPEYVSGHSTFSRAAATVLEQYFGTAYSFTTSGTALGMTVTRTYPSFDAAANDAGQSRILGGIHFQFSNSAGQTLGRAVAERALDAFDTTADEIAPKFAFATPSGQSRPATVVTGVVTDAQSGGVTLTAGLDGGPLTSVPVGPGGGFTFTPALPADGTYTVRFRAVDAAGNVSTTDYRLVLDRAAPAVTITTPTAGAAAAGTAVLTGTLTESGGAVVALSYQLDEAGAPVVPVAFDPAGGAYSVALDLSRATPGSRTVTVRATDAAGNVAVATRAFNLTARAPLAVASVLPRDGASDVGVTYRPRVMFSRPVTNVSAANVYAVDAAGVRIPTTPVLSDDGSFAWVYFPNDLPGGANVTLVIDGNGEDATPADDIRGRADGIVLAERREVRFSTVSRTADPGLNAWAYNPAGALGTPTAVRTTLTGVIADPGPDLKPGTPDDVRAGPDGLLMTADDVYALPLGGVEVYALGRESQKVVTNAAGVFTLDVPAGTVKLVIDGRTATAVAGGALPGGLFFPEMVMDVEVEPGVANTLMGGMGTQQQQAANELLRGTYLPRLRSSILQTVNPAAATTITVPAEAAPDLTPEERARLTLTVPANATRLNDAGQVITANQIGVSAVPPELVREMLPPGVLQHTFDITIQAPGVSTFGTPLALTIPNTFGAAPGTQLSFLSFDHTTGRLEIEGTATVSADGKTVSTDPGTGVTHPGWHGVSPPIHQGGGTVRNPTPRRPGDPGDGEVNEPPPQPADPENPPAEDPYADVTYEVGVSYSDKLPQAFLEARFLIELPTQFFGNTDSPQPVLYKPEVKYPSDENAQPVTLTASTTYSVSWYTAYFIPELTVGAKVTAQASISAAVLAQLTITGTGFNPNVRVGGTARANVEVSGSLQVSDSWLCGIPVAGNFICSPFELTFPVLGPPRLELPEVKVPLALTPVVDFMITAGPIAQATAGVKYEAQVAVFNRVVPAGGGAAPIAALMLEDLPPIVDSHGFNDDPRSYYRYTFDGAPDAAGRTDEDGDFETALPPNADYTLYLWSPSTNRYAITTGRTGPAGQTSRQDITLGRRAGFDRDDDGLPDFAERVIGTNPDRPDTDGDGLSDVAAIRQGLNPFGTRPDATGVVARVPLRGPARAVAATGDLAFVATGDYGLAVVDTSDPGKPTATAELDLPGTAVGVAADDTLPVAVVAAGTGGLHLIDVTDPARPVVARSIVGNLAVVNYTAVVAADGVAYASSGNTLYAYDLVTGDELSFVVLNGSRVTGLAREGAFVYAMTDAGTLHVVDTTNFTLTARGSRTVSSGGGKVFAGNGVVYATAPFNFRGGYVTVDVTNPANPVEVSGSDVAAPTVAPGAAFAANGSGLGLLAGRGQDGANALDVMNVGNPLVTNAFVTRYQLPGVPQDVAIAAGLAFVATDPGLVVVNYRAVDTGGVPPTVTITTPTVVGGTVVEGTEVPVRAVVADDVQVRTVELLVNGRVARTDSAFPYDALTAVMPFLPDGDTVTLQVRATDTGGAVGLSNVITLTLTRDTVAPAVAAIDPPGGSIRVGLRRLTVTFSEPLDPATVTAAAFELTGPTGVVPPDMIRLTRRGTAVVLDYPVLPTGAYGLAVRAGGVRDRAGNAVGPADTVSTFRVAPGRADLLAFYPLDGTFRDASGNGRHGANHGTTTAAAGFEGQAARFDGTGAYVVTPVDINPAARPRLTMGAWVFIEAADRIDGIRQVLSHDDGGFDRTLGIDSRSGGQWSVFAGTRGNQGSGVLPTRGVWTFVAAVYDQPAQTVTVYVNGTARTVTAASLGSGTTTLRLGSNPAFFEFFDGLIDNAFVFGSALTAVEIEDIRLRGSAAILGL